MNLFLLSALYAQVVASSRITVEEEEPLLPEKEKEVKEEVPDSDSDDDEESSGEDDDTDNGPFVSSQYYDLVHNRAPQIDNEGNVIRRVVVMLQEKDSKHFKKLVERYSPSLEKASSFMKKEIDLDFEPRIVNLVDLDHPEEVTEHLACHKPPCISVEYDATWWTKPVRPEMDLKDEHDTIDFMFNVMGHSHWEEELAEERRAKYKKQREEEGELILDEEEL